MSLTFYTDTHISKQVALQLRQKGIDVVRCEDLDMETADDEAHLIYSTEQDRLLITFDKGFRDRAFRWLAEGRKHGGVILVKSDLQGRSGIGTIVTECQFLYDAVEADAATEEEFRNQVTEIG